MTMYGDFAHLYARGPYPEYSAHMADQLGAILKQTGWSPKTILDVACGEGTFAVAAAKQGLIVTGVDASRTMLTLAQEKAENEGVPVEFLLRDMRSLEFEEEFDLATCWYDSLNYVLQLDDLRRTFAGISRALRSGGLFLFDMNTIYGLAVNWQRHSCYVQQEGADVFEVHRATYDHETNIASLRITGFLQQDGQWRRVDETHRERGYSLGEVAQCAAQAGFRAIGRWGDIREMVEPTAESGRIWFAMAKSA